MSTPRDNRPPRRTRSGPVIILGIDPGLTRTGYGVIIADGSNHSCVHFGAVAPPPKAPHPERLIRIHEAITDIIAQYHPTEVAIEDFVLGFTRAAVAVGEARAVATLAAAQAGLPVSIYKPSEIKKFVTTFGRGSKDQVGMMVQTLLSMPKPATPADAADALAVALCHALRRGSVLATNGLDQPPTPLGSAFKLPSGVGKRGAR
ncbi:MAG: crossover junction endodeoxyribonuclease RuvC [Chloroflexota bacterium]